MPLEQEETDIKAFKYLDQRLYIRNNNLHLLNFFKLIKGSHMLSSLIFTLASIVALQQPSSYIKNAVLYSPTQNQHLYLQSKTTFFRPNTVNVFKKSVTEQVFPVQNYKKAYR
jgi:hypothetical protein